MAPAMTSPISHHDALLYVMVTMSAADRRMTDDELRSLERGNLIAVLKKANWKISGVGGAAEFLGIHPATLSSRMRTMKIKRPSYERE